MSEIGQNDPKFRVELPGILKKITHALARARDRYT